MNVSAINCTPIKPQASFSGCDSKYGCNQFADIDDKFESINSTIVESDDIKSPAKICLSVATAIAGIYAAGKIGGSAITKLAKTAPEKWESALKKGSQVVRTKAQSLTSDMTPSKLSKIKKYTGKALEKTENFARTQYTKFAYKNIPANVTNPERASIAFNKAMGAAAVLGYAPKILQKDADGDGVKDIMQKSQNAYTGARNAVNDLSLAGEIVSSLM